MSVEFDAKNLNLVVELEENDIRDAIVIQQMMNHPGWLALNKYWMCGREAVIASGKDGIKTMDKKDLSATKWGILKGVDECIAIPQRIIDRYEAHKQSKENKLVEENNYDE